MSNPDEKNIFVTAAVIAGSAAIGAGFWKASDVIRNFIDSQDKAEARKLYKKALECQNRRDDNEAIRLFRESLKKDPTYSKAYNSIAEFYALRNLSLVEAEKLAISAFNFAQDDLSKAEALHTLAEIQLRQNQFEVAIVNLKNRLIIQKRIYSYYRLAYCYQMTSNNLEGYNSLKEAISLQQNDYYFDLYWIIGDICIKLERYDEAISYLKIADDLSNQPICYGLTDWGYYYQINHREILQIRQCQCLISLGLAYYYLDDLDNSKTSWQAAHQKFSSHPYPVFNLACIAARRKNKNEFRASLQSLMPLTVDMSYACERDISNKVISFSQELIVEQVLGQPTFEAYRDVVLDVLLNAQKINVTLYKKRLELLSTVTSKKEESGIIININDSNVGGFSIGDNSNISSQVSSQELTKSNRDLIVNLPREMDERIKSISQDNAELSLPYTSNLDNKQIRVFNDLNPQDIPNTSLPSSTNTSKKKLNRST